MLGSTLERVELPNDVVARLEGKSSLGRLGLLIHSTAGYVDPGWEGNLTLELSNVANLPITLYDGMKIGQISFQRLSSPVEVAYGDARLGSRTAGSVTRRPACTIETSNEVASAAEPRTPRTVSSEPRACLSPSTPSPRPTRRAPSPETFGFACCARAGSGPMPAASSASCRVRCGRASPRPTSVAAC